MPPQPIPPVRDSWAFLKLCPMSLGCHSTVSGAKIQPHTTLQALHTFVNQITKNLLPCPHSKMGVVRVRPQAPQPVPSISRTQILPQRIMGVSVGMFPRNPFPRARSYASIISILQGIWIQKMSQAPELQTLGAVSNHRSKGSPKTQGWPEPALLALAPVIIVGLELLRGKGLESRGGGSQEQS